MKHRSDIDGLRSLAVLPVVLYHAGLGLHGGFVGVDVFFVISGFLITGIVARDIEEKRFTFANFIERRIRRLFPALFAVLLLTTLVSAVVLIPLDFVDYAKSLIATTLYFSNIHFWSQIGYFTEAAHLKPLLHTWSLAVEEQFYVVLPATLVVLYWLMGRGLRLGLLVLATFVSLGLSIWGADQHASASFYLLPTRAWELLLGGLLALGVFPQVGIQRLAQGLGVAGVLALAISIQFYSTATPFPSYTALLPCLGALFIIWSGTNHQTWVSNALSWKPLVFIGNISYSLYLWHWPVIVFARYGSNNDMSLGLKLACVAISIGLAYLSWRYVEQPFRNRSIFPKRRGLFAGAAFGSVVVVACGLVIQSKDGFEGRLSPEQRSLLAAMEPTSLPACHGLTRDAIGRGQACQRGAFATDPDFILIGDSHADAMSSTIFEVAAELGRSGYQITGPGYLPLSDVYRIGGHDGRSRTEAILGFIDQHEELDTIIIGAFWLHYVTGQSYRHQGSVYVDQHYDGSGIAYNATAISNGLEALFSRYADRQIILLMDYPTGRNLHLLDYVRSSYTPWRTPKDRIAAVEAFDQEKKYADTLKAVASRHPNVVVVPITDAFCGDDDCPLFGPDGSPLFRDGDHVNAVGASLLRPKFEQFLARDNRP